MRNPFDRATEISIEHPKKVLAIGFVSTLLLSSMAMFLEFDNSEDAFFPDNETVRLLDEVETEYQDGAQAHASADGAGCNKHTRCAQAHGVRKP